MLSNSMTNTAVVVGSTGIVGRAIAAKLAELGGWRVVGATRSGGTVPGLDEAIAVDLLDAAKARRRLEAARGTTHLFFAGYAPQAASRRRSARTSLCWSTRSRDSRRPAHRCST